MIHAYDDISHDITNKVNEFENMSGKWGIHFFRKNTHLTNSISGGQQFMSLGSLYSQYIQLYGIWNLEYMNINTCMNSVLNAGRGTGPAFRMHKTLFLNFMNSKHIFCSTLRWSFGNNIKIIYNVCQWCNNVNSRCRWCYNWCSIGRY